VHAPRSAVAHLQPLPLARHLLYRRLDCRQRVVHALLLALRRPRHLDRQAAAACSTRVWATTAGSSACNTQQTGDLSSGTRRRQHTAACCRACPSAWRTAGTHAPVSRCLLLPHPPDQKRYVASHALRICAAQSLPVSRTGTGCFFFLKKDLPAGGEAVKGMSSRRDERHR
jgi:hypothetical protein